jgi:hypothetical protein
MASLQSNQLILEDNESGPARTPPVEVKISAIERTQIETDSRHLGDDAQYGFPATFLRNIQRHKTAGAIFARVQAWMSATTSHTLWIRGPGQTSVPSEVSLAALYIVSVATEANIPLIAHCCQWDNADDLSQDISRSPQMDGLVRMLYSLIRQLTWQAPDRFETQADFSRARFARLDSSPRSLPAALSLFKDLLDVVPRLLFCVIDGLQLLSGLEENEDEDNDTEVYLCQFLEILQDCKDRKVLKALFTTNGFCSALNNALDEDEIVNAIEAVRQGKAKGGKRPLSRLRHAGRISESDSD